MDTILVVDDSATARLACKFPLRNEGYGVIEAPDGRAGVSMFREHKPALVLLDVEMPVMDGLDTLAAIRREDPSAKVVMLTSMAQPAIMSQATRAGARDFLVKPVDAEKLLTLTHKLLG